MSHPLHEAIGKIFDLTVSRFPQCELVKDPACGGMQNIPLFRSGARSAATRFCNVDMLILRNQKIRMLVEIEESNIKPTQIAGKFFTSALATHFIHDLHGGSAIPKDNPLVFIQIIDTLNLKDGSKKMLQCQNIEFAIQSMLPLEGITSYRLFFGNTDEFIGAKKQAVVDEIVKACA